MRDNTPVGKVRGPNVPGKYIGSSTQEVTMVWRWHTGWLGKIRQIQHPTGVDGMGLDWLTVGGGARPV